MLPSSHAPPPELVTRVQRVVWLKLHLAQRDGGRVILSGPSGLGLSFAARTYTCLDPDTRHYVSVAPGEEPVDVTARLGAMLAQIRNMFGDNSPMLKGSRNQHLALGLQQAGLRSKLMESQDPALIVLDHVDRLGSRKRVDELAQRIEHAADEQQRLGSLQVGLVLIGGNALNLPSTEFAELTPSSMISDWIKARFNLCAFIGLQFSEDDYRAAAATLGASDCVADAIGRFGVSGLIPASFPLIGRAIERFSDHAHPRAMSRREAWSLLKAPAQG